MKPSLPYISVIFLTAFVLTFVACNHKKDKEDVIKSPEEMNTAVQSLIESMLDDANNKGKINDSVSVSFTPVLEYFYSSTSHQPVWSSKEEWSPAAASFISYLDTCERDGLFPETYQYDLLKKYRRVLADSAARKIASTWANADLLLTDAYFHILQDLKQGRLQTDSLAWKHNKDKYDAFFKANLEQLQKGTSVNTIFGGLQPALAPYIALRRTVPKFVDSMDRTTYTYLVYPYKDSLAFQKRLLKRLAESGFTITSKQPDSAMMSNVINRYQKARKLKETGKVSAGLVNQLNNTDKEKFKRLAITMDRYKQMPASLPEQYIWVNLPSYVLKVWNKDTLAMESKVIVGKPGTPTPVLNSEISDIVVYPTWTIPSSIILKEILPALKRNPGYLARKGFGLYTYEGKAVDPYSVNWAKYSKGIPYLVRQGSGDNNALGVIKFNFQNPYAVYLHDTNQRYLFGNKERSLSHGCVRVQDWQKLAFYIIRNDSINSKQPDSLKLSTDSITTWIARKERHILEIKKKLPVFIRYFGAEEVNGVIKFYDDIYGDDKRLRERYFSQN
ncbi:MAG: L,D-transpeptidase family protein [Ferruginibacter sp.]